MKKIFTSALGLGVFVCSNVCIAATPISIEGQASITVVEQAVITKVKDMTFGTVTSPGIAGNFVLDKNGTFTCPSGWMCTGTPERAEFEIQAGSSPVSLTYTDGKLAHKSQSANTFTLRIDGPQTLTINSSTHKGTLRLGGTLNIPRLALAGDYSTSNSGGTPYTVTVNY